jgi:acyl-CoA synthetase (AMP-forming)/AMP-acid ligase II
LHGIRASKAEKTGRVNLFYRLEELAQSPQTAARPFLVIPKDDADPEAQTEWTYAEAYEMVLKYARWLKEAHGVKTKEIIAMDFKNNPPFIWMWFALWSIGAIPAFINSNLRDAAFIHCVKISTTRLLILDPELVDVLSDEVIQQFQPDSKGKAVETVVLDSAVQRLIASQTPYRAPDEDRSGVLISSTAILIYTSGTTGLPKAANVAWSKPFSGLSFFPRLLGMTMEDRYYTSMPLYHSSGSFLGVCQVLGPGATIIVGPRFSPRTHMKWISETGATMVQYIGEMCRYMVSSPPTPWDRKHNLRLAFGNGLRPDVWQRFKDRFGIQTIVEFYGATEAPGVSFIYSNNSYLQGAIGRSGLIARVLSGSNSVLLKHDHETDEPYRNPKTGFCELVDTNVPGELCYWLDPANIADKYVGYLGNTKATDSKIIRDVLKKGDVYYRSGDLQRLDEDGRWWFVDRIGDTYRWKGENVSTAEVSEALGTHPALAEANVYGVSLPNHDGRAGCGAISLAEGVRFDEALGTELAAHFRSRLPKYAVPVFLRLLKEIEVTGTLKHQKVALRNQGVDPDKLGADEVYWLAPGSDRYQPFTRRDWQRVVGGEAKL